MLVFQAQSSRISTIFSQNCSTEWGTTHTKLHSPMLNPPPTGEPKSLRWTNHLIVLLSPWTVASHLSDGGVVQLLVNAQLQQLQQQLPLHWLLLISSNSTPGTGPSQRSMHVPPVSHSPLWHNWITFQAITHILTKWQCPWILILARDPWLAIGKGQHASANNMDWLWPPQKRRRKQNIQMCDTTGHIQNTSSLIWPYQMMTDMVLLDDRTPHLDSRLGDTLTHGKHAAGLQPTNTSQKY